MKHVDTIYNRTKARSNLRVLASDCARRSGTDKFLDLAQSNKDFNKDMWTKIQGPLVDDKVIEERLSWGQYDMCDVTQVLMVDEAIAMSV